MVPEGWKRLPLETVAQVRSGVAKGKSGLKDPITVPYLRVANVQDGKVVLNEVKDIQIERHQLERYSLQYGDVLMNEGGDYDKLGRGDVWREQVKPCLHQNHVFAVRPDSTMLDSFFLAALAASNYGKTYFLSCAKRSTNLASINSTQIKEFPVLVPPLLEQKKIAEILSTWDQAITTTERLLENSQQRKKGLMQQLLTGKQRLPGFEGEWESKHISQTGRIVSGGTPDTNDSDFWGGDVQWLTPTDITALKTHFIYDTPRKITEKGVKESSATLMPSGSLCVCTRASVGLMAISTTPITTNQGFKSVIPNNKHDVEFLYYLFSFNRHVFIRYSSGSTFMELSKKDFVKIIFSYPSVAEQKAIARILASANDEIEQLQKRIDSLKQEKKALMQQLLTGKRRVKVDTEAA